MTRRQLPDRPTVSLSLGMTVATGPGQLSSAITRADQQMYAEKTARKQLARSQLAN